MKQELGSHTMTVEQQKMYQEFVRQTKAHLKGMSKNDLVKTCLALLIDNHAMKTTLEQQHPAKQPNDIIEG